MVPLALAYFAAGAAAAGAAPMPGPVAAPGALAFLSPVWPWKVRVGANSPSLWPTMFSVTNTGMNLRPLCTAKVWPTRSGMMVERRDHVFTTFFALVRFISSTFLVRCLSMNGPFLTERDIVFPLHGREPFCFPFWGFSTRPDPFELPLGCFLAASAQPPA